jgi:hypothetical protein
MTPLSGNLPTDDGSMTSLSFHSVAKLEQARVLTWLWKEGRWSVIAWIIGFAASALWIYSGMPMICH